MKDSVAVLFSLSIFLLLTTTACGPKPKYTNRFESYTVVENPNDTAVTISAFSLGVPDPTKTTILSLSERGQAEFIRAIKEYSKENNKDFIETLGSIIKLAPQPPSVVVDKTVFKRRVVFSVQDTSQAPADRIEHVKITLTLNKNQNQPEFKNWDLFSSKYETVDLGTLQYKQTNVFGITAGGSVPISSPVEISANAELSRDLQETILLKDRRIVSTGQLTPHQAIVIQEGSVGIDLTGNMTLDVEIDVPNDLVIEVPITSMAKLFEKGKPNESKKVSISRRFIQFPKCSECSITGDVTIDYVLRHVKDGIGTGEKSIAEGDDIVVLGKGTAKIEKPLEIIPSSSLAFPTWSIVLLDSEKEYFLHLDSTKLRFDSYENAVEFFNWSNLTKSTEVGGRKITFGGIRSFRMEDILKLNIKRTVENKDTCDKGDSEQIECDYGG